MHRSDRSQCHQEVDSEWSSDICRLVYDFAHVWGFFITYSQNFKKVCVGGKPPGFFKLLLIWLWKTLFFWQKIGFTLPKEHRVWWNCITASHKRTLGWCCLFQFCPLQREQNSMLVLRHSCYTMLSNLVDLILLRPLFGAAHRLGSQFLSFHWRQAQQQGKSAHWGPELVDGYDSLKIEVLSTPYSFCPEWSARLTSLNLMQCVLGVNREKPCFRNQLVSLVT